MLGSASLCTSVADVTLVCRRLPDGAFPDWVHRRSGGAAEGLRELGLVDDDAVDAELHRRVRVDEDLADCRFRLRLSAPRLKLFGLFPVQTFAADISC